jgi:hypothetical protein
MRKLCFIGRILIFVEGATPPATAGRNICLVENVQKSAPARPPVV